MEFCRDKRPDAPLILDNPQAILFSNPMRQPLSFLDSASWNPLALVVIRIS
jgi:hypothetical protein